MEKLQEGLQTAVQTRYEESPFDELSPDLKRQKILEEQDCCCLECKIEQEWNGKPLKFHLDHKDGDRTNNNRENLRLLCPNCHSQTETYTGRNKRKVKNEQILALLRLGKNNNQICVELGINASSRSYARIDKLRESL